MYGLRNLRRPNSEGATRDAYSSTGSTTVTSIQTPVGSATPRAVRLTAAGTGSYYGAWKLPVLDPVGTVTSFDATFKCQLYNTGDMADGFTFNFGAIPGGSDPGAGESGFSMANGMYITFDTYPASGGDGKQIRVYANGIVIGSAYTGGLFPLNTTTFNTVVIHWDANGLDMTYNGAQVFLDRQLPGFIPAQGNSFAFSARTGGVTEDVYIDDVQITTTVLPPITTSDVVISEFVADNGDGIEDEDGDTEDWIELYNGTASPVDMNGWRLTNLATNTAMWTFPSVTIPPFNYLRVFASGKNRTSPVLHTNFTLVKAGGYVALVKPDGTTKTSEFNYPQQSEDVSYGTYGVSQAVKFMYPPTPGTSNESTSVAAADGRPSEEVIFSRDGGLFSGTVQLGVTAPLDPAAVIRYSTDGTVPTETSPVFSPATPLTIATSTQIRARTFQPGRLPGDVSSRTFLLLDSSLASYGTSGQPFQSNLPIVVIESWGVNIDAVKNPGGARPHRPVYTVALDKDPLAGNVASITALPNFQGRGGMHVRGQTSSDFGQKPYAWEVWTNEDTDKNVSLLGMPADADWVLQTIYNDKTGMRNMLPQTLIQEVNGIGAGVRAKFVEVFFNQDGGPISYADYRGVYVLMEHIERGTDRVDISKLSPLATDPTVISGGYIFKKDKLPQAPLYSTTSSGAWGSQTHEIVEPDTASVVQVNALKSYVQAFDNALSGASFADPALGYKAYIEPQTFMDNHLWVEVFKQIDGYRLSTYYTKDRGQKIKALPIWDYNLSGGNANYGGPLNTTLADNPVGWYYNNCNAADYPYYPRLFADNDFKQKYWDRYWKLRRGVFATSYVLGKVDAWANELTNNQYATNVTNGASVATGGGDFFPTNKGNDLPPSLETPARLESPIARHFDRWPVLGVYVWPNPAGFASRTTFQSEVQWMKDWLTNRLAWIDSQWNKPPNFSIAGGNILSGTPLTITNPNPGGVIYYTTDGTDPSVPPVVPETVLVDAGAQVKWMVPSVANGGAGLTAGAGASQWTNFNEPANIANWVTSVGGVGYDRSLADGDFTSQIGGGSNTETAMYGVNTSCYIRITFTIPDQATIDAMGALRLSMKFDDGFRAYINGTAVHGVNDQDPSMTSSPSTAKTTGGINVNNASALIYQTADITTLGKPALRVGTNVLAIHGLNSSVSNNDFLNSAKLTFTTPPPAGAGQQIYSGPLTIVSSSVIRARVLYNGTYGAVTEGTFIVGAQPASAANLVVAELCYDPAPSGLYSSKDLEFITLRNISPGNVDLTGVQLSAGVIHTLNGTTSQLTLPPGGEIVIAANTVAFQAVHGAPPPGVTVFGPFEGALDNSGELFSIRTAGGSIIKEFAYSALPPWPSGAGGSLVLQQPSSNPDHSIAYNWRFGSGVRGTPYTNDSVPFTGSWAADANGDGYADGIAYTLGTPPQITVATAGETVGAVTGNFLRITFRRSLVNDAGVTVPELSMDLSQPWQSGTSAFERISIVNNGDGTCTETWRTLAPVTSQQVFTRLKTTSL